MKQKATFNEVLKEVKQKELIHSYDVIGDIIVIRLHPELESQKEQIAEAFHTFYPKVRTIVAIPLYSHTDALYRTRDLDVIWGDERFETTHKESGCVFKVDLKHVFFSPRLSYERQRVAQKVAPGETIINLFSGVGCFSILIAKTQPQTKIYSVDVNPYAYEYMTKNVALNKVEGQVIPILGDALSELEKLEGVADRVLMPLPEEAYSFLPSAVKALNPDRVGMIHYYDVSTGNRDDELFNTPFDRVKDVLSSAFGNSLRIEVEEKRIVRSVGPHKYHVVLDLRIAFG
jgi:tRNA (guanine37-N1)-methyltransferase